MGPFDEVIFHISGFEGGLISKLVSGGGGKRSTYLGDCVTVNIVTDNAEEDEFVKIKLEEAKEVCAKASTSIVLCFNKKFIRFGGSPTCQPTG